MSNRPDAHDDRPAQTGQTQSEHLEGSAFERTVWPIGPPAVACRNVFLVITTHVDGVMTVQVAGNSVALDSSID